jgi:hypothetical protein
LEMHPEKSGIVYCKDSNRRKVYHKTGFTFLGVRVPAENRQGARREDMDIVPACDQCHGKEADHANDPSVEPSETYLYQLE